MAPPHLTLLLLLAMLPWSPAVRAPPPTKIHFEHRQRNLGVLYISLFS